MKIWYKAVCDKHKEMVNLFVNDVVNTNHFLSDKNDVISCFLKNHINCSLRLIHDDIDLDECYNKGYVDVGRVDNGRQYFEGKIRHP